MFIHKVLLKQDYNKSKKKNNENKKSEILNKNQTHNKCTENKDISMHWNMAEITCTYENGYQQWVSKEIFLCVWILSDLCSFL